MKLLIITMVILTFLLYSLSVFASVTPDDTLQSGNHKQTSNKKEALFHPTILFFQTGSYNLDDHAISSIEKLVVDSENKSNISFIISGYTDPAGSDTSNQKLSEKRVESVKQVLLKKGFTETQLILKAIGESQSANTPLPDYSKMRKVEIQPIILQK
jgi:outer membrane protein OmpA-like peptidoglycan-associated protein